MLTLYSSSEGRTTSMASLLVQHSLSCSDPGSPTQNEGSSLKLSVLLGKQLGYGLYYVRFNKAKQRDSQGWFVLPCTCLLEPA